MVPDFRLAAVRDSLLATAELGRRGVSARRDVLARCRAQQPLDERPTVVRPQKPPVVPVALQAGSQALRVELVLEPELAQRASPQLARSRVLSAQL